MDDSGRLMDADPNISETADSTVKAQGYSYVNDYGELKTYFADSLSDNKGVKIQKNESEIEFGFCVPEKKEGNTLTKLFFRYRKYSPSRKTRLCCLRKTERKSSVTMK